MRTTAEIDMGRWGLQGWLERWAPVAVFALAVLAQLPLVRNPGYFSHDELQWAAFAGTSGPIPWVSWTGVHAFQYRPLTFNLWLWLSRQLFAQPQAFHALLVAWGAANAALLCALARRWGVAALPATIGALVFALGPNAAYVHGWIATIGDLAWVSCALLAGLLVIGARTPWQAAIVAMVATAIGLLAKEAALAIPPLLALAWWLDGRSRRWAFATLASGAVAAGYLALRLDALLHAPREGAQYSLTLTHVPLRWIEYQLYPLIPKTFEIFTTLATGIGGSLTVAGLLWSLVVVAMWRASHRIAWAFLLGGIATLLPVLPLAASENQYGYGFAALTAAVAASAWTRAGQWGRTMLALAALVSTLHGVKVMAEMRHVGEVQSLFSPSLAATVLAAGRPILIRPPGKEEWIYLRLTHGIASYNGVPIGDRVRMVATDDATADYQVMPDGSIAPAR
jgi:hypothetical protein